MQSNYFVNRCIRETLSGLRDGLTLFTGIDSRSAVIFAIAGSDELYICDPQSLLRGHEPRLKSLYLESDDWCKTLDSDSTHRSYKHIQPLENLQLDGLISNGGSSSSVYYQMWFTEHHPNICSLGPAECWLEHAVLRFSHDIANDSHLYTGISGSFLREYGSHAVHDCLVDKIGLALGLDVQIQIYPMLDAILGISKTNEEGARPHGTLTFIEPRFLKEIKFLARFQSSALPLLSNFKHVRKLLQAVEHSDRTLISDGISILGIAEKKIDSFNMSADFQGKLGFLLVEKEAICSFQDGSYSSDTHRAKLFEIEETLLDYDLDPSIRNDIFKIITSLVHNAEDKMFGCTIVIDLATEVTAISGQKINPPANLKHLNALRLATGLSKVDGALHIRADLHLHGFACLLDGHRVDNEDRARGARYNSALRFTAQHPETLVVVVSSDRPVSIFRQGKEIGLLCGDSYSTRCALFPQPLSEWILETG